MGESRRKRFPSVVKWKIASKQQFKCTLCNKLLGEDTELDHRRPLYSGGADKVSNLQAVHARCHATKSRLEATSRGKNRSCYCFYCDSEFSRFFINQHIHADEI